ncbi:MFS transporter [Candidatus Thorarchaeota archaeon]|nr:MAG: MFS transporter [Candidatus Thorarchaeota archaeon]
MQIKDDLGYIGKIRLFKKDAKLYIAISSFGAFSFGISGVIFNLYLQDAGFSEDFIGFFLSVSMFATAAVAFVAGLLTDKASRKKIILAANIVVYISVVVQYTTLNTIGLLLSQVFLGLSSAFREVAWSPYLTDLSTERERAHLFGFAGGISLLAVLAGNLLGGFLPQVFAGMLGIPEGTSLVVAYQYTLWISLIPSLFAVLLVTQMTTDTPTSTNIRHALKSIKNWGFIGKYASTITAVGLGAGTIVMFFNLYFTHEFPIDSTLLGIIFALNTILLSAGNFLAPALADRIGKVRTVVVTELLSIPFLVMLWWAPVLQFAVLGYVMRSVLMNMSGPVSNAFFMEGLSKDERATAVGVVRTGDSLVRAIAANIGGWLLALGLYRLPYLLVSGLYILGIILFYGFFRKSESDVVGMQTVGITIETNSEEPFDVT